MNPGNPEESQTDKGARDLDKLYRESERAMLAPDLDVRDDDVVEVGSMRSGFFPSVSSGFFPAVTSEESDSDSEKEPESESESDPRSEVDEEIAAVAADAPPTDGRRTEKSPTAPSRSWPERLLAGLLVANTVIVGAMLFAPGLFQSPPHATGADPGRGQPPSPNVRPVPAGGPVDRTSGGTPAAISETMPDYDVYESAQYWIGRGYYDKATRILENYLNAQSGLSAFHSQAVHSSLAYCAHRLGQTERADAHSALVENFRRLAADPEDLWAEANQARTDGRTGEMRQICARLLLKQDDLEGWTGTGRIEAVRTAIGDSYRIESKASQQPARVVR